EYCKASFRKCLAHCHQQLRLAVSSCSMGQHQTLAACLYWRMKKSPDRGFGGSIGDRLYAYVGLRLGNVQAKKGYRGEGGWRNWLVVVQIRFAALNADVSQQSV